MDFIKRYLLPRFLQYLLVMFVGITLIFIIPRFSPMDPVEQTLSSLQGISSTAPEAAQDLRETLRDLYGLEGSLVEQYISYWSRILKGDLGPSLSSFPTPVIEIIKISLPWTMGLMGISIILSWLLGMVLGTLTSYFFENKILGVFDAIIVCVYPVPYYVMAFLLVMLLAYVFPIFPLTGGVGIGRSFSFSWNYISSLLYHGFLPALSLIIINTGFRYIMQKALTSTEISSGYVKYAEAAGVPKHKIMFRYVMRNTLLPQLTDLALSVGVLFGGAIITEYVFSYPGIGMVLYSAIMQSDFNMIMGVSIFSVVALATAAFLIDLIYPLIDPRIRYK